MRAELCIGGAWRAGGGAPFASSDPAHGGPVWSGLAASGGDVRAAVEAAADAFPGWASAPVAERSALLRRFAQIVAARSEDLARLISREMGKPLWDARAEVQAAVGKAEVSIAAQTERAGRRESEAPFGRVCLRHRPHGVMAVLGPFNFPLHLPNGHIAPAVLAGNTVVFKPSELAPAAGAALMEAWVDAGAPPGVINLVQGGGDVGATLITQPGVAGVLFTGSADVGAAIHRTFAGRPEILLALEMGGNAPLIVWEPADAAAAANLIAHSAFLTSGQRCSCARRLILPQGAFGDAVLDALVALLAGMRIGAWSDDPEPFMGPLVTPRAAQAAEAFAHERIGQGARALTRLHRDGALLAPLVLETTEAPRSDREIFAPVLEVIRVADFDAAIACANATKFGLAAGLLCDESARWARIVAEVRAGVLNWNRPTTGASSALPFGGPGASGNLRPGAFYAADYCAYPVAMQVSDRAQPIPAPGLPG